MKLVFLVDFLSDVVFLDFDFSLQCPVVRMRWQVVSGTDNYQTIDSSHSHLIRFQNVILFIFIILLKDKNQIETSLKRILV